MFGDKWEPASPTIAEKQNFGNAKAGGVGTPVQKVDVLNGEDPRLQLIRMRIKTATMQNDLIEVDRLTEMMRKVEAGELPMPGSAPAAAAVDPLDRLKRLAEQKAKILEQT
jgi:hypothetical protein